jgi:NitT/TauT family transport system ATP-binding protein
VMDIPTDAPRTLDDLYTPQAAERLNILRHQIEIAQGRTAAKGEAA